MNIAENRDTGERNLSECFDEALATFEEIESCALPTNSSEVQYKIKKCMNLLEEITRNVSLAGMFSENESYTELSTDTLKFLLLPCLLGTLVQKLTNGDRKDIVLTAEVYLKDFIRRCKNYELTDIDVEIEETTEDDKKDNSEPNHQTTGGCSFDIMSMARRRATKIRQYNEQKELESQLGSLKECLKTDGGNEEIKRRYYMSLIKSYIGKAIDDLEYLQSEKVVLNDASRNKQDDEANHDAQKKKIYKSKPLLPVIITRDEFQKKVFGAGYPSLPAMTVQELYEQRLKDGTWTLPGNAASLQDMAKNEELKELEEAKETIRKEEAMEKDDPDLLERSRQMDEYKDTHKRGWGNRQNRS